jgi:hypothetical protein
MTVFAGTATLNPVAVQVEALLPTVQVAAVVVTVPQAAAVHSPSVNCKVAAAPSATVVLTDMDVIVMARGTTRLSLGAVPIAAFPATGQYCVPLGSVELQPPINIAVVRGGAEGQLKPLAVDQFSPLLQVLPKA